MTNEGILVKLHFLIPEAWMEGARVLKEKKNLGVEKGRWERGAEQKRELGNSCGEVNRRRGRPEAGRVPFDQKMPESGDGRTIRAP